MPIEHLHQVPCVPQLGVFGQHIDEMHVLEFRDVLKQLMKWLPEILAFHHENHITNGRLEGQNNKLGVLKRIAYGFVNADNFGARAMLWCPPVPSLPG